MIPVQLAVARRRKEMLFFAIRIGYELDTNMLKRLC